MKRIWYNPDGTIVAIEFINSDPATIEKAMNKYFALGTCNLAGTFHDCANEAEFLSIIPVDRVSRHKWRKGPNNSIIVDSSIPDLPHPKRELIEELNAATTIAQVKAILRKILNA